MTLEQISISDQIIQALGFTPKRLFKTDLNILVEMDNPEEVRTFAPDLFKLSVLPYQGLIITAFSGTHDYDFVSRYFAPRIGIAEDPVTGSAHCSLAPYWAPRLKKKEFTAFQSSERGGILKLKLENDSVILMGQAVTVFSGNLEIQE